MFLMAGRGGGSQRTKTQCERADGESKEGKQRGWRVKSREDRESVKKRGEVSAMHDQTRGC